MERLLNIDELSEFLGVAKATIYSRTSKNKIPHVKLSKRLLKFREGEIAAWLSQRSVDTEAPQSVHNIKNGSRSKSAPTMLDSYVERVIQRAKKDVLD